MTKHEFSSTRGCQISWDSRNSAEILKIGLIFTLLVLHQGLQQLMDTRSSKLLINFQRKIKEKFPRDHFVLRNYLYISVYFMFIQKVWFVSRTTIDFRGCPNELLQPLVAPPGVVRIDSTDANLARNAIRAVE